MKLKHGSSTDILDDERFAKEIIGKDVFSIILQTKNLE